MGPAINSLATDYDGRAVIGKLNVDDAGDIARTYEISSIPALLFFKDGKVVDRMIGGESKASIAAKLDSLIGG